MTTDEVDFGEDQTRRALIQQLEGLRRAGVTHWKRIEPIFSTPKPTTRPEHTQTAQSAAPRTGAPRNLDHSASHSPPAMLSAQATPVSDRSAAVVTKSTVVAQTAVAPPIMAPRPPFQPLDLPLVDRVAGLAALAERVKNCTRCQELVATRTKTVFGVGNPQAKILFLGEAPGADEDAQGEPFVGKSGKLLNDIIKACRIQREEIYICNVIRCRPPGNRQPATEEAGNCREYLDGQIAHVNPEYIVCWGTCAAQNLLGTTENIGKLRRKFFTYGRAKVLCTYHPAYLLRNPAAKKDVWEDIQMLFLDMGIDLRKK